jgi:hypothetical protein
MSSDLPPEGKPKRKASFIMHDRELLDCPAYITAPQGMGDFLNYVAKVEYGNNNGSLVIPVHAAARAIRRREKRAGSRMIAEAVKRGFLTLMKKARHGGARGRLAAEYRLNSRPTPDGSPPTKLYLEWRPEPGSDDEMFWVEHKMELAQTKASKQQRNGSPQAPLGDVHGGSTAPCSVASSANGNGIKVQNSPLDGPIKVQISPLDTAIKVQNSPPLKEPSLIRTEGEKTSRTHARVREASAKQIAEPSSSFSPSGKKVEPAASPYPEYAKAIGGNMGLALLANLPNEDIADPYLAAPKICYRLAGHGAFASAEELAELAGTDLAIAKDWLAWKQALSGYAIDEPMAKLVTMLGAAEDLNTSPARTAEKARLFRQQWLKTHDPIDWPTDA